MSLNLKGNASKVTLLGVDISHRPPIVQFFALSVAIFAFYLIYGYVQESLFQIPGMRPFGWYLTFLQFVVYSAFSFTKISITGAVRRIPYATYFQIAFYTVASVGLSNASVGYLNYPTQVIFKCCKLIPVLIGGIIIQGKRYGCLDVLSALLMSVGLVLFTLTDNHVSPNFSAQGFVMISLALVADAIIGNVQEKAMRSYSASNDEVVLYSYSIGSVYVFCFILLTGELFTAFSFFSQNPLKMYCYAVVYSIVGYLGVNIVLTLVRVSGALVTVTVTTMRKALTIILSFYIFHKPFAMAYVWSGMVVLVGICLNVYNKNRHACDSMSVKLADLIVKIVKSKGKLVRETVFMKEDQKALISV